MDAVSKLLNDKIKKETSVKSPEVTKILSPQDFQKEFENSIFINKQIGKRASQYSQSSYDLGDTGLGQSQYDNNISLDTILEGGLNSVRASRQGFFDKLSNTLIGGVSSGGITAVEGVSNLVDQVSNLVSGADQWEQSAFTELLGEAKKGINTNLPIYRKNPNEVFDLSDSGWYFELTKGIIDSAIGFGVPGAGYAGLVGKIGSGLGRAAIMGKRLDVLSRAYMGANFAPNVGRGAAALLSNLSEGTVLALETYDQTKESSMKSLTENALDKKKQTLLNNGATEEEISNVFLDQDELKRIEDEAIKIAGDAGHYVRNANILLAATGQLQFKGIFGLNKSVARDLVRQPSKAQFWKNQLTGAPVEALEEISQGVLQKESAYQAQQKLIKAGVEIKSEDLISLEDNLGSRLLEFATSDETLLEGLMGLVSGPFQYAIVQAPFNSGQKEQQNKRFAIQQSVIGGNQQWIKNSLTQSEKATDLASRWEEFRDEYQIQDKPSEEQTAKFFELIENSSFDILAVQNFFTGTTEKLEQSLNEVLQDENATEPEKESAQKHLGRLKELEAKFVSFNKYEDGANMFSKNLRIERLNEIEKVLTDAFTQSEANLTANLNAQLDLLAEKDESFEGMENNIFIENDKGEKTGIRSVSELVGILKENKFKSDNIVATKKFQEILNSNDVYKKAILNKINLDQLKTMRSQIIVGLDEDKSVNGQDLTARFNEIINSRSTDTKEKVEVLKNLQSDKRLGKNKFDSFKQKLSNEIKRQETQLNVKATEVDTEEETKIKENKAQAKAEVLAKTQQEQADAKAKADAESLKKVDDTALINPLSLFETADDPASAFKDAVKQGVQDISSDTETTPVTKTETTGITVTVPEIQIQSEGDFTDSQDPEIKPSKVADIAQAQVIANQEVKKITDNLQKTVNGVASPNIKIMDVPSNSDPKFDAWMTNGKSKAGEVMNVEVDLNPNYGVLGASQVEARQAVAMLQSGSGLDMDFLIKFLPVKLTHSLDSDISTYMFNKNPKLDWAQKESEKDIKKAAIDAYLKGQTVTIKIKDQAPGQLQFSDTQKFLSEMPGKIEDMNIFYQVAGTVQPVSGTRNPFYDKTITYTLPDGSKGSWEGILILEVNTLSGQPIPLKLNTRSHTIESATVVYDLLNDLLNGKNLSNPINSDAGNRELYAQLIDLMPSLEDAYTNITYTQAISDLVYANNKTKDTYGELYFEGGVLHIAGRKISKNQLEAEKDFIINTIIERKGFNVSVKKMKESLKYKKHVFTNHIQTNANVEKMFDINRAENPEGDKTLRMMKGAIFVDSTSLETKQKDATFTEAKKQAVNKAQPVTLTPIAPKMENKTEDKIKENEEVSKKVEELEKLCDSTKTPLKKISFKSDINIKGKK